MLGRRPDGESATPVNGCPQGSCTDTASGLRCVRSSFRHRDGQRSTMRPDTAAGRASCTGWIPMVPHQVVGNRVEQSRAVVSLARWALEFYTAPMALDGPAGLTRNCWWAWLKSRSSPGAGAGASPSWSECLGSTTLMASGRVWTMTRTLHPDE